MTAQQIMQDARVARVRELKDEISRLQAELENVRNERDGLRQHLALAMLAARDAERIGADGTLLIVDGWNALLGSERMESREALVARTQEWLAERPGDRAWIVFDGDDVRGGTTCGRLRTSYTGGTGSQRADRLVCDYLRMWQHDGAPGHVLVVTGDKAFRAEAERLGARTEGIGQWTRK